MTNLQKNVIKRKNNADLRISADPNTLVWLSDLFKCGKEDAVAVLVNIANKENNNNDICEI